MKPLNPHTTSQTRHRPPQFSLEFGRIEKRFIEPLTMAAIGLGGGSLLKGLFGGDDEPEQKQMQTLSPEQQEFMQLIFGQSNKQVGQGVDPYPGQMTPGSNPMIDEFFSKAEGFDQSSMYGDMGSVLERAMSMQPAWDTDMGAADEYWTDSFLNPAMSQFKRDILPQLREDFAGMGAFDSSGRDRAEVRGIEDLFTNLTGQKGNIMFNELMAGRGATERGIDRGMNALPSAMNYQTAPLDILRNAGMLKRGVEGEQLGEKYQKWNMSQPYNNPWLSMGQNMMGVQSSQPYLQQPKQSFGDMLGDVGMNVGSNMMGQYFGSQLPTTGGGGGGMDIQALMKMLRGDGGSPTGVGSTGYGFGGSSFPGAGGQGFGQYGSFPMM